MNNQVPISKFNKDPQNPQGAIPPLEKPSTNILDEMEPKILHNLKFIQITEFNDEF